MWPTLVSIGPIAIHSFGLLLAAGIFFGGFVLWQKGREESFDEEMVMDSWLLSGVAGLVLGRIWYILFHWQAFGGSWYKMLFLTKFPGLAYEGVWLGAVVVLILFAVKRRWDVWLYGETAVMAWLTVEIFAWLGSFLAGSTLGRPTSWWWGVRFPGDELKRQPVQLLFLVLLFILGYVLNKWEKEYRSFGWYQQKKGEAKPGFLLAVYMIGLGLMRISVGFLSEGINQWFGLGLVLAGSLILLFRSGITVKHPVKSLPVVKQIKPRRKKKGFDFK